MVVFLGEITAAEARPPARSTRRAMCRQRVKSQPARERRRQAAKEGRYQEIRGTVL